MKSSRKLQTAYAAFLAFILMSSEFEFTWSQCGGYGFGYGGFGGNGFGNGGFGNDLLGGNALLYILLGYALRAALGRRRLKILRAEPTDDLGFPVEPGRRTNNATADVVEAKMKALKQLKAGLDAICTDSSSLRCRVKRKKFMLKLQREKVAELRQQRLDERLKLKDPVRFNRICRAACRLRIRKWQIARLQNSFTNHS